MAVTRYKKIALTGGGADALDGIDGANLLDADEAHVYVSDEVYHYQLDASSGAAESSPEVISPDANPGTKRWILQPVDMGAPGPTGDRTPNSGSFTTLGVSGISTLQDDVKIIGLLNSETLRSLMGKVMASSQQQLQLGLSTLLMNLLLEQRLSLLTILLIQKILSYGIQPLKGRGLT